MINTGCNHASEMRRMQYSDEQRLEALTLLARYGKAEASRRTGIPAGTIASWGVRNGVKAPSVEATRAVLEHRLTTIADRKARLAEDLAVVAQRMLADLMAPTVEQKALVVSDGRGSGSHVEIAEIHNATTTPAERRMTIEAVAKAIETVQLLTGAATARTEQLLTAKQAAIEEARERSGHLRAV